MAFRLDWKLLLSDKRFSFEKKVSDTNKKPSIYSSVPRTEFERDYDRVVFSTPFRRLARKTQVHPFAEIDHVHNRLTHSLEVSSVGRSLAAAIGRLLISKKEMPKGRTAEDVKYIVQAACLAHDIGNPPFGHAGEYAIREWTKAHATDLFGTEMANLYHGVARDWLYFEGNAQSFRLVVRDDNRDQAYFRFTYASLGTMIKYPWNSRDLKVAKENKYSVFSSEEGAFNSVIKSLGLRREDNEVIRHPLSFLSETADDICYRITDFEDAVQMKILTDNEVRKIFKKIIGEDSGRPLSVMRAQAINRLIEATVLTFREHYDDIMCGKRDWSRDLKSDFPPIIRNGLDDIKERYQDIFGDRRKIAAELGAYNVLGKILSVYSKTVKELSLHHEYGKLTFVQQRCIDLAWGEKYVISNKDKKYEWWLGRVMDFVSGMTDNYATQVAGEIEGI